jgi:sulfonate transport system ATP-binding protein
MALVDKRPAAGDDTNAPVATVLDHHRSFGATHVLAGVNLELRRGEFVALLGRSGSGKSTLLRSLAHLDPAPDEEVRVTGRTSVSFQEPRLLPWRKVGENVGLALLNTTTGRERADLVARALDEVGLTAKSDVWPVSLSGGEAQRVSLARALVSEPDLLLLDEPFSALDALTRIEMHRLVTQLWERHQPTVLLVTHDVDEALALADRVLVLEDGAVAAEWRVPVRRTSRTADHPQILELRSQVLNALGVDSDNQNNNATKIESGAA